MNIVGKTIAEATSLDPEDCTYGSFAPTSWTLTFTDGTEITVTTCGCCGLWEDKE